MVSIALSATALRIGDTSNVTFTFTEAVSGFNNADITVPNGSLTNVSTTDNIVFTATLTPTSSITDATNIITVAMFGVLDMAGNPGAVDSNSDNYAVDTVRPERASISIGNSALKIGSTATVSFTFTEAVTEFTLDDVMAENGTLTNLIGSNGGLTWSATLTPSSGVTDSSNSLYLDNTGYRDLAGNAGVGVSSKGNYAVDTVRPALATAITLSDSSLRIGETATLNLVFSEAVMGFETADLLAQSGAVSNLGSDDGGFTWTATFTPSVNTTASNNTVMLDLTGLTDLSGNSGTGSSESGAYVVDTQRPVLSSVTFVDSTLTEGETTVVTFTFSEAVTGFTKADLIVVNGSLSSVNSSDAGLTWTATFTPTTAVLDASNVFTMDMTGVADASGNAGTGTTDSPNYAVNTVDITPPTVTIVVSDTLLTIGETTAVTFTFSEAVTQFTTDDVTVQEGAISNLATSNGGTIWTATLTPDPSVLFDYENVITLALSGVTDLAGNAGSGTTDSNNFEINGFRPSATIVVSDNALSLGETSQVTFTFSEAITGFTNADLTISNGALSVVSSQDGGITWTATFTPYADIDVASNVITLTMSGVTNAVGNTGNGSTDSNSFSINTTLSNAPDATPATAFDDQAEVIGDTVTDNASSGLNSAISANQTMMQAAKGRFIAGANQNLALDVDGSLNVDGLNLSTMGTFYGQSVIGAGARRLIFGSFDIQRDGDTSTTTFSGKIAWEKALSDKTMMGFFIGAEVARSNLQGSFTGGQDHFGLSLGGYAVQELASQIFLDGFVSLGAGRNNLTMTDGVLDLDSDYATRSATFGASVSGVIAANGYEVLPELSLSIGRTWIEEMAFTGTAYGVIDNTLRQDASMVTLASLTFRPQIRMALDGEATAKSKHVLTFAPRLICQQATTTACGRGAEIGLQSQSSDGMTTAAIQVQSDLIDGRSSTTAQIKLEHRF
jgi:hypothetical protein